MIAKAIADKLQVLTIGTVGTDIFVSAMPPTIDNVIGVYDSNGFAPDPYLPIRQPGFQIVIRNTSYATGKAKLDTVRDALHKLANLTQSGVYFYNILAMADGGYIGRDEQNRHEFSINFKCQVRTS